MNRASVAALSLVLACCLSAPAAAQDYATSEPTPEEINQANTHFEQGANRYLEGDYEGAIQEFEAGYEVLPNAIFLYNISLAYSKLDEPEQALRYAERAEEKGLEDPDRSKNRARIQALHRVSGAQRAAVDISQRPPDELVPEISTMTWIGAGVAGAGIFALLGTLGVDRGMASDVEAYRAAAAANDQATYDELERTIKRQQTVGRLLFFTGVPLVLAGTGIIVWELYFREPSDVQVGLTPTAGGLGITFGTRF